ncbi:MAG TPA: AMP-binding protein, partial [Pseudonocardiaceae bacterium]|nr:AMP-binding protein [Pseudonocardiaceae bacterium]
MNTGDLIEELEGLGVQLWAESGQLRFRAPKGVMTPERLATIKAHKQELLARLGGSAAVVADEAGRHEPFPLTDVQSAYLLGRSEAFGYGGVACHGYFEVAFAELDPARLESAWQRLVDRHDMLRAVIDPAGHQRVLPDPPPYRIGIRDVRGEPRQRLDDAVEAVRAELSHRVYDPQQWPLFELRVTRADGRDVLHVSIDLLVADYASIQLLLAELDREYTRPGDHATAPLEITFRDVLLAERAARQGPSYEADRSWWHERVDTLPPAPELPLAEQPEQAPPRFVRHHTRLDRARWARLRRRATERDLSPAGALLAGYAEVVGSWSRRPGFTLNLTLLNRPPLHPQVGELVGDFTSVTLLAVEPEPGAPFAERAAALQRRLWTDLDHRRYSGVEVVRELARRRGAEAALMPVVFTSTVGLADAAADAGEFTGSGELVHGVSQTPQVWIDCQVMEHRGELLINWDVRDGVFPDGLVEDMFAAYEALIGRLATGDGAWTQPRPVALPAAQATRRAEVNDTAAPLPRLLLHEPVLEQARRNPDRTAVIAADRALSFAQLLAESEAVAARLLAAGSRPAEPVAVVMDKGWEQVVAVLGVLLAGAAYLPIDTNQPPARRASMLSRAAVRHVLTQPWRSGGDWPDGLEVHAVPCGPPACRPAGPPVPAQPDDLAYVIYTSGSTGSPKGVMISHRGAVNTVLDINDRFEVTAGDRVLGLANLGFDLSVYDIFGVL